MMAPVGPAAVASSSSEITEGETHEKEKEQHPQNERRDFVRGDSTENTRI